MTQPINPDLTAKVDRLKGELAAEVSRTRRSTFLTGLVGAIALIALFGYFTFGYMKFEEATQPEHLVNVAQTIVNDNLPEARKSIEAEVVRSAPIWAEGLSKQARDAIPTAREKLEEYVLAQVDEQLKRGTVLTEERFRNFLRQNQDVLKKDLQELSTSPELAEQSLTQLETALSEQLEGDMKTQAHEFFTALGGIIDKLNRYKEGKDLNRGEQVERQVLLLVRRLQHEQVGGAPPPPDALHSMPSSAMRGPRADQEKPAGGEAATETPALGPPPGAGLQAEGPSGVAPGSPAEKPAESK
jgi:hypothetical protein